MSEELKTGCANCKFWGRSVDGTNLDGRDWATTYSPPLKTCGKMPMLWDAHEFVNDEDEDDCTTTLRVKPEYAEQKAFTKDGSDYMAYLLTRGEFFCAHHESE